jgi:methionyl-tRNA synthetase
MEPERPSGEAPPPPASPPESEGPRRISIDRFFETELVVGRVLAAERVAGADKLLRLEVDLGTERRQLVAGIAKSYEPEALVGKRIVVVANLEPARIRGVESQGMLLAADLGGRPIVATFDEDVPPGTRVR